ncbi:MAG: SMC-Scp complex subunit ScpB [Kiloniellaceae bacterium]
MTSETPEIEIPEAELPAAESTGREPTEGEAVAADAGASEFSEPEASDDVASDEAEADAFDEEDVSGDEETGASDFDNLRLVEALLFASAEPLAPAQLARFLPDDCVLEPLLADLEALYANRGVNLVKRGGRWAFRTAEDLAPRMELENKVVRKLSRVALETLAVIAYHQPVTRAEIEEIRGVALSKGTLDALLEIGWIRPKGRRKTPGRPVTWGTSDAFLDHFGLESTDALPGVEELKAAGLLDARPALTALGDRGLLPAAGDVMPEAADDEDDDDSELIDGSERELLEETFGENLLPQEVDLAASGGAVDVGMGSAAASEDDDEARADDAEEAEAEMSGGAGDAEDFEEDADFDADEDLEDALDVAAEAAADDDDDDQDDDEDDDPDEDQDEDPGQSEDDAARHHRQRSAG